MSSNGNLYVQWGCGLSVGEGWLNYDSSPTVRFERLPLARLIRRPTFPATVLYGDIVKGLPLPDNSCAAVYSSHALEHLSLEDGLKALQNTFKILKSGGTFRIVLPNIEACIRWYVSNDAPNASHRFMEYTGLGVERRSRGLREILHLWLGSARHLWMWDYKALQHELAKIGFVQIRQCKFGDSPDPMFAKVEALDRFDFEALAVECVKP